MYLLEKVREGKKGSGVVQYWIKVFYGKTELYLRGGMKSWGFNEK